MADKPQERLYDLGPYKQIVGSNPAELIFRIAGLNGVAVLASFLFRDPNYSIMALVYNVFQMAFLVVLFRLPTKVDIAGAALVYGLSFATMQTVMIGAIYSWVVSGAEGKVLGVLLVMAVMLYTVSLRMHERIASRIESGVVAASVAVLAIVTMLTEDMRTPAISMVIGLFAVLIYYIMAVTSAIRAHEAVESSRISELQRARMEAIGQLAGGVAHDFNNLLTIIKGNMQLRRVIQRQGGSLLEAEQLLHEAEEATERAERTTKQLLAYSRRSVLRPQLVALESVVLNMEQLMRTTLPANIALEIAANQSTPEVFCDVGQLENVILNLIINARDAMPEGGHLRLEVEARAGAKHTADPSCVVLSVTDTGEGIAPEVLSRVTEPFFTTKKVGKGSGLGLSMARGVMEQSGGKLEIASDVGGGTVVRLSFPVASARMAAQ